MDTVLAEKKFILARGMDFVAGTFPDLEAESWLVCANEACVRCVIIADEGTVKAFDVNGNEITVIESLLDLLRALPDGVVLDGGLVLQDSGLSDLDWESAFDDNAQIENFTFNVHDCLATDEFYGRAESPMLSKRLERLAEVAEVLLKSGRNGLGHLHYTPHLKAETKTVDMLRAGMESAGWRGIILRKDVPYTRGITPDILKINV